MTRFADSDTASVTADHLRRTQVVLAQTVQIAWEAVRALEAHAEAQGRDPGGHTVALRGRLEEVRGRAEAVCREETT